jgi:UDP:flavonoid glycosyltransferase YjiC (YdhE family)
MGQSRHVLFLSRPDPDHLYPSLAVAEELGRRGYRVTFATGDPFADEEAAGDAGDVVLLRYGRDPRTVGDLPALGARGPVDLVVCEPATREAALALAAEWGVRVVVAHGHLPAGGPVAWPAQRSLGGRGVYVRPGGRGTVHAEWVPGDPRPVLVLAADVVPVTALAAVFGAAGWQVVAAGTGAGTGAGADLPAEVASTPGFTALAHADVVLVDGGLPGIAAAVRSATPMVLVPRAPEEHRNAARVAGLGLGVLLPAADLTPAALLRAVSRLGADEAARAALRRARSLVAPAGAPESAADTLESALTVAVRAA